MKIMRSTVVPIIYLGVHLYDYPAHSPEPLYNCLRIKVLIHIGVSSLGLALAPGDPRLAIGRHARHGRSTR